RADLPIMEHSSGLRFMSSCDCGRTQAQREDPFSLREANYEFYQNVGVECGCVALEHYPFPVFQPSTEDFRDNNNNNDKDKALVRQPSTTEYLPGMLHTDSPSSLLPQYPSWSLTYLGPSSLYSHNLGLPDPTGSFISSSSYLLPWDVTVRLQHHSKDGTWSKSSTSFTSRSTRKNKPVK
ncbi:protein SMG8, partial [Diaphorina citri]|uniref:Nonsense-mediated mRNA decay factor SMG8 n=1 Tax=Diaphorina citri TaxID=121845 RepID=A0A1S3DK23_DIACI